MLPTAAGLYKKDAYSIARNLLPTVILQKSFYEMDIILVQQLNRLEYPNIPVLKAFINT